MIEKVLGILDANEEGARIMCVQVCEPKQTPTIEFRHQRLCGEYGWTTHKRITLAPGQFQLLRDAMNLMDMDARLAQPTPGAAQDLDQDAQPFLKLVGT